MVVVIQILSGVRLAAKFLKLNDMLKIVNLSVIKLAESGSM